MEEFKVLAQFLLDTQMQLQAQLYGLRWNKDDALIEGAALTSQVNLLGIILNLPIVVKQISEQFEKNKVNQDAAREIARDPLEKELI